MDDNITLKIDPESRDLVLNDEGFIETISENETSAQAVRLTLEAWKGEFELVPSHGTDYTCIMGKKPHELEDDEIGEVIRAAIFQESTVKQIDALETTLNGRDLGITFIGQLTDGTAITTEVKVK